MYKNNKENIHINDLDNIILKSKKHVKNLIMYYDRFNYLIYCLAFGMKHKEYNTWVSKASFHLEFLGSLGYIKKVNGKNVFSKLSRKEYEKAFDGFFEYLCDAQDFILGNTLKERPKIKARDLLDKYKMAKEYLIPMIMNSNDHIRGYQYKSTIDYIVKHKKIKKPVWNGMTANGVNYSTKDFNNYGFLDILRQITYNWHPIPGKVKRRKTRDNKWEIFNVKVEEEGI